MPPWVDSAAECCLSRRTQIGEAGASYGLPDESAETIISGDVT